MAFSKKSDSESKDFRVNYENVSKPIREHYYEFLYMQCEPCQQAADNVTAIGYCMNCSEYLCEQCFNFHKNYKAFRNHLLKEDHKMQTDIKHIQLGIQCKEHEEKTLEFYCKKCDKLACTVCMMKNHKNCSLLNRVHLIEDMLEDYEETDEYKKVKKDVDDLKTVITDCKMNIKAEIDQRKESKSDAMETVTTETKNILTQVNRRKSEIEEKVRSKWEAEDQRLNELKKCQEESVKQLEDMNKQIEHCKLSGDMRSLFIAIKKNTKIKTELENILKIISEQCNVQYYSVKESNLPENIKQLFQLSDQHDFVQTIYRRNALTSV